MAKTLQLIRDADYGDAVDAIKPAGNSYSFDALTGLDGNADLPIYGKALYVGTGGWLAIVGARDKRENPSPRIFLNVPDGTYLQMEVRRIVTDFSPAPDGDMASNILVLHDNRTGGPTGERDTPPDEDPEFVEPL